MSDILNILSGGANDDFYTSVVKEWLDQKTLILNDSITDDVVELYVMNVIKWNLEDKDIPVDKRVPIKLIINSCGGDAITGFNFVDVIMQSKTPIRGICLGMAASMSYHILIACHERYAFNNSILLQHDGSTSISNSTSKARDTMEFIDAMEERAKKHILEHTIMTEEFYDSHYDKEYYMYADEAKSLGCIDKIIGIDIDLEDLF